MLTTTLPNFLTFLGNNPFVAVLALVAWISIVGAIVWTSVWIIQKFRQYLGSRTAARAETPAPSSEATDAPTPEPARVHAHHQKHPPL